MLVFEKDLVMSDDYTITTTPFIQKVHYFFFQFRSLLFYLVFKNSNQNVFFNALWMICCVLCLM